MLNRGVISIVFLDCIVLAYVRSSNDIDAKKFEFIIIVVDVK